MNTMNLCQYSFWGDIRKIESTKDKKNFNNKVIDFINCVYEMNNIHNTSNTSDIVNIYNDLSIFLLELGVINTPNDIPILKTILKTNFNKLLHASQLCIDKSISDVTIERFKNSYRKNKMQEYISDKSSPTLVDFFCGSGGLSLGFHREGFKILLANDIEDVCTNTYAFNHYEIPKDKIIKGDIKEVINNLHNLINQDVDIVMGGPPCQGFSMANRQRLIDDPRNILYKYFVKSIEHLKPKFFIMENVKGMLSVANQVKCDFHNLNSVDYDVEYSLFNAKDFSVPQNRERLIYIGIRSDIKNKLGITATDIINEINSSNASLKSYVLSDALYGLPKLDALTIKNATELDSEESGKKIKYNSNEVNDYIKLINNNKNSPLIFNHKARYNNDRDIEIYKRMLPGDKSDSPRIADIMPYKSRSHVFKDKYYKLKMNEVCKTITAHMKFDCNMYIHPTQARGLTPREAARIQSYPDDYFFLGPYTKTYMQIGNSVPPLMSNIFAKTIKKYILLYEKE